MGRERVRERASGLPVSQHSDPEPEESKSFKFELDLTDTYEVIFVKAFK